MYLVVDKSKLKDELETISTALGGNDAKPISSHFLFRVGEDSCEILSAGGPLVGYVKLEGLPPTNVGDEVVSFTVEGNRLMGFIGAVDDGDLAFEYDKDSKRIHIVPANGTNFNLVGLDVKEFTDFEADFVKAKAKESTNTILVDALLDAIDFCKEFTGENLSNPGFSLARLKDDGTLNTGNGKSAAIYKRSDFAGEFKLRAEAMSGVVGFVKKSTGTLNLYEGDNYYFLENAEGNYYGWGKVSFDFPSMKVPKLFEEVGDHIFEVDVSALKGALNRLRWSLDSDLVRMGFKLGASAPDDGNQGDMKTKMLISAKNSLGTISEEEVEIGRTKGDDETLFYLNYKYVLQGVDKFEGDRLTFYLNQQGHPFIKILEKTDDSGVDTTRVLFLGLMKRDR